MQPFPQIFPFIIGLEASYSHPQSENKLCGISPSICLNSPLYIFSFRLLKNNSHFHQEPLLLNLFRSYTRNPPISSKIAAEIKPQTQSLLEAIIKVFHHRMLKLHSFCMIMRYPIFHMFESIKKFSIVGALWDGVLLLQQQ